MGMPSLSSLSSLDKAFYFILCVGYIASEEALSEVERDEKENWLEKHD